MGALTETEIFDCMVTNLRLAIEDSRRLAASSLRGAIYDRFRKELKLIEGCCRQASAWRSDTRWLPLGLMIEQVHAKAGSWLRGVKLPDGTLITFRSGELNPLFTKLAEKLEEMLQGVIMLRDKATGRSGVILPDMVPGPHRDTRPSRVILPGGMYRTHSGLILP